MNRNVADCAPDTKYSKDCAPLRLRRLTPALGTELIDARLDARADELPFDAIFQAFLDHQVLLFRGQELPPSSQVEFARRFGELQIHVMNQYHADGFPELYRLSNLDAEGKPSDCHPDKGTLASHTDGSWQRLTGQATIIYGEVVPESGGDTHICDMYGAYQRLSQDWKSHIDDLRAVHSLDFSRNRRHGEEPMTDAQRKARPPVDHPIVRTHPETGRKCLFLGDHAESIAGMDYDEGRTLIDELNALAIHADLVYEHHWVPGDLLVWDNRCLQHRALPYDAATQSRVIRRCTVLGESPC